MWRGFQSCREESYSEKGIKCQKAAETITLKSISVEKGQSFAARPIQWNYFLPCSFPRDFPRAPSKYHPAMSQLAAVGLCSGMPSRVVPPRNAPCQTCLIRRVLLNYVAPGQVWQGLRELLLCAEVRKISLPLFQVIHLPLTH